MTTTVTDTFWVDLWEENKHNSKILYESKGFETIRQGYFPHFGKIYESFMQLRNGLCPCTWHNQKVS